MTHMLNGLTTSILSSWEIKIKLATPSEQYVDCGVNSGQTSRLQRRCLKCPFNQSIGWGEQCRKYTALPICSQPTNGWPNHQTTAVVGHCLGHPKIWWLLPIRFFLDIGKHEFRTSRKQHLAHGSRKDTGNSWYEYLGMPGMPLKSTNQNVPYIIYIYVYVYIYNYTYIFIYIGFHL